MTALHVALLIRPSPLPRRKPARSSRLDQAKARVIGPTRPMNISRVIASFWISFKPGVTFIESPDRAEGRHRLEDVFDEKMAAGLGVRFRVPAASSSTEAMTSTEMAAAKTMAMVRLTGLFGIVRLKMVTCRGRAPVEDHEHQQGETGGLDSAAGRTRGGADEHQDHHQQDGGVGQGGDVHGVEAACARASPTGTATPGSGSASGIFFRTLSRSKK